MDLLVVGSGVAGSFAAVRLAARSGARVAVLTKGRLEDSTTQWAQGGIAAVMSEETDSTESHLVDTLRAGAGLCDESAVRVLVEEGPSRVAELIALGAVFDRTAEGELERSLEGGHSRPRVVHAAGAATGAEVARALGAALRASVAVAYEGWMVLDLVLERGRCAGVVALAPDGSVHRVAARHVLLATGGAGQLFAVTTNPPGATGDGAAMALRAGLGLADVEFVQFHPTALHVPALPRPLLSEALRGEGAVLRGANGERFVDELEPRHVVSRAIAAQLAADGSDHVLLDATPVEGFALRFPSLARALEEVGLDPARDWLPVAPAAHYISGGLLTDLDGATALPGLWAAGEAACSGVQGANRLASNSLLEGLVFGSRVADAVLAGKDGPRPTGALGGAGSPVTHLPVRPLGLDASPLAAAPGDGGDAGRAPVGRDEVRAARRELQRSFSEGAGVVRSASSLASTGRSLELAAGLLHRPPLGPDGRRELVELANLVTLGAALLTAATRREESRGAHVRSDFPEEADALRCRFEVSGPVPSLPGAVA
ncbi:MAG: FAD-binding protein [Actinomycetota bacterium]|nr:FAD-binding protein [Actinomycetota bacterium]